MDLALALGCHLLIVTKEHSVDVLWVDIDGAPSSSYNSKKRFKKKNKFNIVYGICGDGDRGQFSQA